MRHTVKDEWFGDVLGVNCRIIKWVDDWNRKTDVSGISSIHWNYYLRIFTDNLPPERFAKYDLPPRISDRYGRKRIYHDYYDASGHMDFHGGCTWYEKNYDGAGELRGVEFGCDYGHYGDYPEHEDFRSVFGDLRRSVISFLKSEPDWRARCGYCGEYFQMDDIFEGVRGEYRCADHNARTLAARLHRFMGWTWEKEEVSHD